MMEGDPVRTTIRRADHTRKLDHNALLHCMDEPRACLAEEHRMDTGARSDLEHRFTALRDLFARRAKSFHRRAVGDKGLMEFKQRHRPPGRFAARSLTHDCPPLRRRATPEGD